MVSNDPHYNRKPVPDEFIEHVGDTGMTRQEEYLSRERKLSSEQGDLRKFWNPKNKSGALDPHYSRKPVPDSMIHGVGETGLTPQEEYENREQKMMVDGVDLRRFSASAKGGMAPQDDPYYGRKPVNKAEIQGVGESNMSRAEEFETRENKASLFDLSADPFEQLSGKGHRASVSGVASEGAADARRRSSAVAPDAMRANSTAQGMASYSGFTKDNRMPSIDSRNQYEDDSISSSYGGNGVGTVHDAAPSTTTTSTTTTTSVGGGRGQHGLFHDVATMDANGVAPNFSR